jgi:type II secretory pathway component PulF
MLFSPRISLPRLAAFCRRLAIGTAAGIDVRTVWRRETEHGPAALQAEAKRIHDAVSTGGSVGDALAGREYFPKLFRQLVSVGEQTGSLAEVYKRLADHYEYQVKLRRSFLTSLTWPMIQLGAAIGIVGILIWAMGFIAAQFPGRKPIDPLGLGLIGTKGLIVYGCVVAAIACGLALVVRSAMRGAAWTRPLQRMALHVPVVGRSLRTIALARMAWTLQLALNSAMEVRQALRLSLEYSGNDRYASQADAVCNSISSGSEIHESLRATGVFPEDFLDAVEVAEHSGALVESLERLSRQYEEQAQAAMTVLTTVAGFLVWAVVAALIVTVIFRLFFTMYLGPILDASRGKF